MNDRLAIVTGTSSGIGLALARRLVEQGWQVIGAARRNCPVDDEAYHHVRVDLGDGDSLRRFMKEEIRPALDQEGFERIALVNNAALMGALGWLRDSDPDRLSTMFAVNATAPIVLMGWITRQVEPETALRIVNVSSGAAHSPIPGLGDYCATKAALRIAGQTLAGELEREGRRPKAVAVLSFEPGLVETDMQRAARSTTPAESCGRSALAEPGGRSRRRPRSSSGARRTQTSSSLKSASESDHPPACGISRSIRSYTPR